MAKNTRFLSEGQAIRAAALGLIVDSDPPLALNPNLGGDRKVWDDEVDSRHPVLIRVQNVGTQAVFWSEAIGQCTAAQFNGVLPGDSVGGAAPAGDGGIIEFRAHIPHNVYLFASATAAVRVTKRFAE